MDIVHFLKTKLESWQVGGPFKDGGTGTLSQQCWSCLSFTVALSTNGIVAFSVLISWMDRDEEQTQLMFKINVQILNEWDRSINDEYPFPHLKSSIYLFERNPSRKLCWLCTYML